MKIHELLHDQATRNAREKLLEIHRRCEENRHTYFPDRIFDFIHSARPLRVVVFSTRGLGFCQHLDQIEAAVSLKGGCIEALVHDTGDIDNIKNPRLSKYHQITTEQFFSSTSAYFGCLIVDRTSTWYPGIRHKIKLKRAGFDVVRIEQFLNAPGLESVGGLYRHHSDIMLDRFDEFLSLERHWKDKISLQTYYYALASFISMNYQYFALNCGNFQQRYFPEDIDLKFNESTVYADCGSYDGAEILIFSEKVQHRFKAIHAFEPDQNNFLHLKHTIQHHIKKHGPLPINCHEMGVFNRNGYQRATGYDDAVTITNEISEAGVGLHVCKLDSVLDELGHLRLEIEGAELPALQGARQLIGKHRPTMAVAAYHLATDFPDLLKFIEETDQNYQLFLRHQSLEPGVLCIYAT